MTLDVQNLSSMKYHIELAIGSTMASVIATDSGTFAISIRQVIAIRKWPMVYMMVRMMEPLLCRITPMNESVNSVIISVSFSCSIITLLLNDVNNIYAVYIASVPCMCPSTSAIAMALTNMPAMIHTRSTIHRSPHIPQWVWRSSRTREFGSSYKYLLSVRRCIQQ